MIESDTIKLLRECDAGVEMGVRSISEVENHVKSSDFRELLQKCKEEHQSLKEEMQEKLHRYHDEGKSPALMATGMSWMKTNLKLAMEDSDQTVADLMTDGCNMGVKSLSRYLNKYKAAEEEVKDVAKKLIASEERLAQDIRGYL